MTRSRAATVTAVLCGTLLAGCASDPSRLPLGVDRAQALQQLGPPTSIYALPGAEERLQYSYGPAGFAVFNVDLDATGPVRSVRQELNEGLFANTIRPG